MSFLLYQNDHFALVNKPSGVSFHSEGGHAGFFEQAKKQLGVDTLFPVHRLDKITSGLLLLAKTSDAAAALGDLFSTRSVEKFYLAVARGKPKKKQGWVKGDMGKARRGAFKLLRSMENPAITQFVSSTMGEGVRVFLVKPHSGKTHQIRVALKSIGVPILGDELYGGDSADRGYLHAYALRFELFGQPFQFSLAPDSGSFFLSSSCQNIIARDWAEPWQQF